MNRNSQSGNIIFIILIGIVLFAALSYAVSGSMRSGTNTGDSEKIDIQASEILSFSEAVATTVTALKLNGCGDSQISFEGPITDKILKNPGNLYPAYTNSNTPADKSCRVFDPAGGGMKFQNAPQNSQVQSKLDNAYYNRGNFYLFIANSSVGTSASNSELLIILPFLNKNLCTSINKKMGVSGIPSAPYLDLNDNWPFGNAGGVYNNWGVTGSTALSLCVEKAAGEYYYYRVLINRI